MPEQVPQQLHNTAISCWRQQEPGVSQITKKDDGREAGRGERHLKEALLPVQKFIKVQVSTEVAILGRVVRPPSGTPGGPLHICQLGQGASLASAT